MNWIDGHIHVSGFDREGNPRGDILPDLLAMLEGEDADLRLVLSADAPEVPWMRTDPEWIERANAFIFDLCARAGGRFYGSCLTTSEFPEESEQVLRKAVEQWGFVQYGEILPEEMERGLTRPEVVAGVELAASFGLPAEVHLSTNYERGIEHVAQLAALAEAAPQAKYIAAHAIGGRMSDYYIEQLAPRVARGENFWVEIRDFNNVPALRRALREIGAERLVAGTDWTNRIGPPYLPYGVVFDVPDPSSPIGRRQIRGVEDVPYRPSVAALADFLGQAGATPDQIEMIGWRNGAAPLWPRALGCPLNRHDLAPRRRRVTPRSRISSTRSTSTAETGTSRRKEAADELQAVHTPVRHAHPAG